MYKLNIFHTRNGLFCVSGSLRRKQHSCLKICWHTLSEKNEILAITAEYEALFETQESQVS